MSLKIEDSEKRFRDIVQQAPLGISIFRGPEFVVEMANETYLQLVDKKENDFAGNPLFNSLPEVEEIVSPLLTQVSTTGIAFHATDFPVNINRHGKYESTWFITHCGKKIMIFLELSWWQQKLQTLLSQALFIGK